MADSADRNRWIAAAFPAALAGAVSAAAVGAPVRAQAPAPVHAQVAAQAQGSPQGGAQGSAQGSAQVPRPGRSPSTGGGDVFVTPIPAQDDLRLSRLVDLDVVNLRGLAVGRVEDVVIDLGPYAVRHVAIRTGGLPGRTVAAPLAELRVADSERGVVHSPLPDTRLVLRTAPDGLREAPGFDGNPWTRGAWVGAGSGPSPVRASEMLRAVVLSSEGRELGRIRDAILDAGDGRLRYVIVALDEPLRDTLVAVAPRAIAPGPDDGTWTVEAGTAEAAAAPRLGAEFAGAAASTRSADEESR